MQQRNTQANGTAAPIERFPPVDAVLWETGLILATLLGLAWAANILSAHGAD